MGENGRKVGRPPKAAGPKLPSYEVERLLVEGELVAGDDGVEKRVWPTQRAIAERFNVSPSLVAEFSKRHRCAERRAERQAQLAPPATTKEHASGTTEAPPDDDAQQHESRRKPGRPRKQDAPHISYEELDRLLVFGEVQVLEDGTHTTVYPTYRALAERFGVVPSVIASYAKSRNCLKRREQTATRIAVRTEEKLIDLRAEALAVGEDRLVQMIDEFLLNFEKALKEGRVRTDSPADVNTLARLKAFILGGADSRQEVRSILSLEALQERYARMSRDTEDTTPAIAGVIDAHAVVPRETEHADSNTELSARFPPPRALAAADVEPNIAEALRVDLRELADLARKLASAKAGELEDRVRRAADAVDAHLAPRDGADVGARGANEPEDEG